MTRFTLEKRMRIHDDESGSYIDIREDADGLDLIEIVQSSGPDAADVQVVTMPLEQARLVSRALAEVADHVAARIAVEASRG